MTFQYLENETIIWARNRGIIPKASPLTQYAKLVSEVGELGDALIKGDRAAQLDAIGDSLVCLIIEAELLDTSVTECLKLAYDTISKRKGVSLPNGTFVKDTPETPERVALRDLARAYRINQGLDGANDPELAQAERLLGLR